MSLVHSKSIASFSPHHQWCTGCQRMVPQPSSSSNIQVFFVFVFFFPPIIYYIHADLLKMRYNRTACCCCFTSDMHILMLLHMISKKEKNTLLLQNRNKAWTVFSIVHTYGRFLTNLKSLNLRQCCSVGSISTCNNGARNMKGSSPTESFNTNYRH